MSFKLFAAFRQQTFHAAAIADLHTMKIIVVIGFILILGSLGFALFFMMKDKGKTNHMATALAFRVGFSIALFLLLLLAYHFDLIQPTGIIVGK